MPGSPERIHAERIRIEESVSIRARIFAEVNRTAVVIRLIDARVVHAIRIGSNQRIVPVVDHGHGKSAGDMGDAGERPAARQPVGMEELIEGQLIVVADDEVVLHIERRDGIAERRIEGVDLFADVRRLVQRLAVGVGGIELEPARGVARAEFERVVVGVADVRLEGVAAEVRSQLLACSIDHPARCRIVDRIFAESPAGQGSEHDVAWLAQAQAESGIARILRDQHALAMRGGADIARVEDSLRSGLALD